MSVDYKDLFEQCGLDEEWQAENKERIEKFLDRIEVRTEEDMAHVMEHFGQQYDTSMKGVRMMLAVVMKETIDWILAGEERDIIIQYSRPTMGILSQGMHVAERRLNEEAGYTKYYSRGTSILMVQVCLGTIFDKTNELIEIGEDMGQTAGRGHCSEYQVWEGGLVRGWFPKPTIEVSCGFFCDQAPEAEALLADEFGYPIIYTDMPQDHQWGTWPRIEPHGTAFLTKTSDDVYDILREKYDYPILEDDLTDGAVEANLLVAKHLAIANLIASADPQPVSQADMALSFWLYVLGTVYTDEASAAMKQFQKDIRARIREGVGVVAKGAPRIYLSMRPVTDFHVYKLLEEVGIAVPLAWFDAFAPEVTNYETEFPDRPFCQNCEIIYRFPGMGDLKGSSLGAYKWVCDTYNMDGIMLVMLIVCRPDELPITIGRDYLSKECPDLPCLVIEMDAFDSRNYTPAQWRTRFESFAEVLRLNQAMKED